MVNVHALKLGKIAFRLHSLVFSLLLLSQIIPTYRFSISILLSDLSFTFTWKFPIPACPAKLPTLAKCQHNFHLWHFYELFPSFHANLQYNSLPFFWTACNLDHHALLSKYQPSCLDFHVKHLNVNTFSMMP